MSSNCVFHFDNPQAIYYSGQTVSGTLELTTTKRKTITSMHIVLKGRAETGWTEDFKKPTPEGHNENSPQPFTAEECYLLSQTFVYGQSGGHAFNLPPGRYTYPFQALLPYNCPTSMNGSFGQIRYEVIFTIDKPAKYPNIFKIPFTVISPLDLNSNPAYLNPMEKKEEKEFCCGSCFGNNNPILVETSISQTGFAPGQSIAVRIAIDNQSNTDCPEVKAKLYRNGKYITRNPEMKTRNDELKIAEVNLGSVEKCAKKDFNGILQVPSTCGSTLETCSIIKIEYFLVMHVKVSGIHRNIDLSFPITIGTVPVNSNQTGLPITAQPGLPPSMITIPSPTYEEDVNKTKMFNGIESLDKNTKNARFIPKYPTYKYTDHNEISIHGQNNFQGLPQQLPATVHPGPYSNPMTTSYPPVTNEYKPQGQAQGIPAQGFGNNAKSPNPIGWSM